MPWGIVDWQYQDEVTSAKLAQMVENLRVHDHRADGSQGVALVEPWQTIGATAAAGWSVGTKRGRRLLGGALLAVDLTFTRTGGELVFSTVSQNNPGNLFPSVDVGTLPEGWRPSFLHEIKSDKGGANGGILSLVVASTGVITLQGGTPSNRVRTGDDFNVGALLLTG